MKESAAETLLSTSGDHITFVPDRKGPYAAYRRLRHCTSRQTTVRTFTFNRKWSSQPDPVTSASPEHQPEELPDEVTPDEDSSLSLDRQVESSEDEAEADADGRQDGGDEEEASEAEEDGNQLPVTTEIESGEELHSTTGKSHINTPASSVSSQVQEDGLNVARQRNLPNLNATSGSTKGAKNQSGITTPSHQINSPVPKSDKTRTPASIVKHQASAATSGATQPSAVTNSPAKTGRSSTTTPRRVSTILVTHVTTAPSFITSPSSIITCVPAGRVHVTTPRNVNLSNVTAPGSVSSSNVATPGNVVTSHVTTGASQQITHNSVTKEASHTATPAASVSTCPMFDPSDLEDDDEAEQIHIPIPDVDSPAKPSSGQRKSTARSLSQEFQQSQQGAPEMELEAQRRTSPRRMSIRNRHQSTSDKQGQTTEADQPTVTPPVKVMKNLGAKRRLVVDVETTESSESSLPGSAPRKVGVPGKSRGNHGDQSTTSGKATGSKSTASHKETTGGSTKLTKPSTDKSSTRRKSTGSGLKVAIGAKFLASKKEKQKLVAGKQKTGLKSGAPPGISRVNQTLPGGKNRSISRSTTLDSFVTRTPPHPGPSEAANPGPSKATKRPPTSTEEEEGEDEEPRKKRQRAPQQTDLDVILGLLEETMFHEKEGLEDKACRRAMDRFVFKMQEDLLQAVETARRVKQLQLEVRKARTSVTRKRQELLDLKQECLGYSGSSKKRHRKDSSDQGPSNKELNAWLQALRPSQPNPAQ